MKSIIVKVVALVFALAALTGIAVVGCNAFSKQGPQGEQGAKGETGESGKSAYELAVDNGYSGTVQQWLASLVGEIGESGKSAYELAVQNGYRGSEQEWLSSLVGKTGENGKDGVDGINGKSAYELAVENGFKGNLSEWLNSLVGKDGADGTNGTDGKSAYELAVENGFKGNLSEWLNSLVGKDGADGTNGTDGKSAYELAVENGFKGSLTEWLVSLVGAKGTDGKDGVDGTNGTNGKDGISVTKAEINANGELVLTYSNGTISNLGKVVGDKGETGANGADGVDGENGKSAYELAVEKGYKGDLQSWLASLVGANGTDGKDGLNGKTAYEIARENGYTGTEQEWLASLVGEKGEDGKDGVGIQAIAFNANGELIITLTNGNIVNCGKIPSCEHSYSAYTTVSAATCTSMGVSVRTCSKCGFKDYNFTSSLEHSYVTTKVNATCSSQGYTLHSCSNCGNSYKDTFVNASGTHAWQELYVAISTCSERTVVKTCSSCGTIKAFSETPVKEHSVGSDGICSSCEQYIATDASYFYFSLLSNETYSVKAKNTSNLPTSIFIPAEYNGKAVTSIGDSAFSGCSGLTSVVIGNSVTSIGDYAFCSCSGLTSVVIGNSVTSIGSSAFYECSGLTSVVIPNSVTSIGDWAFEYCSGLTSVVIPNSVTSIGSSAFYNCSGLTSVVIGNSVTSIGDSAFYYCNKLVEVINYSSLNITKGSTDYGYIGKYALNVKTSGATDIVNKNGYLFYTYNNDNFLLGYIGTDTNLVLPDSYNGQSYQIYKYAFSHCRGLTSVVIGNSVTSIGDFAFRYCDKLVEVINYSSLNITKGGWDYGYVGYYALNVKTSGTTDIVNKNGYLFYTYNNVNYLLGYVGTDTDLVLPDSYNGQNYQIYKYAFYDCDGLTSVVIGNSVTSIGDRAFYDCDGLTSVVIPDNVTSIGQYAFCSCSGLTSVVIGNSVTSIGKYAFDACIRLTKVYYNGTANDWNDISIGSDNSYLTNASRYYYSKTQPTDSGTYWHYDSNGNVVEW